MIRIRSGKHKVMGRIRIDRDAVGFPGVEQSVAIKVKAAAHEDIVRRVRVTRDEVGCSALEGNESPVGRDGRKVAEAVALGSGGIHTDARRSVRLEVVYEDISSIEELGRA